MKLDNEAHPEKAFRKCVDCACERLIENFPRKGNARSESRCKECFNRRRKMKRSAAKVKTWAVAGLPVSVLQLSSVDSEWVKMLFGLMKENGMLEIENGDFDLDILLKRQSRVEQLIA
ncbi:hypothetical protein WDW37_07410 [Bdellovibrionota bacterium FG-1]